MTTTAQHTKGHCQVCNRLIGVKAGNIAHHGYTRPGNGWQTASCMGAKALPYELSCNVIQGAVDSAAGYEATQKSRLELLTSEGNPTFTRLGRFWKKDAYTCGGKGYGEYVMENRTYEWDQAAADADLARFGRVVTFTDANRSYELNRKGAVTETEKELVNIAITIKELKQRIIDWKKVW